MSILKQLTIFILTIIILILSNCFDTNAEERKKNKNDTKAALLEVMYPLN